MKRRRLLLSAPLLPTITETLEDLPSLSASSQSNQSSQSLEDYMTSIQALARPVEAPSHSITRLQRSPRSRLFTKNQVKVSASPRTLRTSRPKAKDYSPSGNITEELSLKMGRDKDPVDWLFGQIRTWKAKQKLFKREFNGTSNMERLTRRTEGLRLQQLRVTVITCEKCEHLFILIFCWFKSRCLHAYYFGKL